MRVILTKKEFKLMRECIVHAESADATVTFNKIFKGNVPGINPIIAEDDITLDFDQNFVQDALTVLDKHVMMNGRMVSHNLFTIPKTLAALNDFWSDIKAKFKGR